MQKTSPSATTLEQILIGRGWVTRADMQRALRNCKSLGGTLGTCLLETGSLSEERLARALSEQYGVPWAEIDALRKVPEDVIALLPARLAVRCRAVPFHLAGTALHVAMLDPLELDCHDEIAFACGKRIHVHVASEARIFEALDTYYGHEAPSRLATLLDQLNRARYLWKRQREEDAAPRERPAGADFDFRIPNLPDPVGVLFPDRPKPAPVRPAAKPPAAAAVKRGGRPEPPPPPSSIKLSPEELRRLYEKTPAKARPRAAEPRAPLEVVGDPFTVAEAALHRAEDREAVGRALVEVLSAVFEHAALFVVRRDRVEGWLGAGSAIDTEVLARLEIPLDIPSAFLNLKAGSPFHMGPLAPVPAHRELASCWGGRLPEAALLMPVRLHERLVAVLYGDRGEKPPGDVPLGRFQAIANQAGAAFERCIMLKKKRASGSNRS